MIPAVAIPALVALLFKAALLSYSIRSSVRNFTTQVFLILLVVLALHNLVEFIGFIDLHRNGFNDTTQIIGFAYVALLTPAIALILHISLLLSFDIPANYRRVRLQYALYLPTVVLLYLLLFTDKLVVGFEPFQNTVLRIPGPLYSLFETYIAVYLLAALANLVIGARPGRTSIIRRTRNRLWLLGLLPTLLLLVYLIVANHFGWTRITSTIYIPITLTFFLVVTTYATHEHRLFDIEFFIPWSKVRKRKTAFYRRIQATIAEVVDVQSVKEILGYLANALHCQVALVGGPRPLVALANDQQAASDTTPLFSDFPLSALQEVDHIVVANEIADSRPALYALMQRYRVGAIVPFNAHSAASAHWMLLGERFSEHVYTPLDFRNVELLFDKIAERFVDNLLLLRSQLAEAKEEVTTYQHRLALAWDELTVLRRKVAVIEEENRTLRAEKAALLRKRFTLIENRVPQEIESGQKTLTSYLIETERDIVLAALKTADGDRSAAARILRVSPDEMQALIERHLHETKS